MKRIPDISLYLVTDRTVALQHPFEYIIEEAVKGGVTVVQLREKHASSREFYELAVRIKRLLSFYNIPLIINDRLDIALACDADGVHIGQQDIPYPVARKLLGKDKIIGLSVESVADTEAANAWDVDYIAVSPVFGTPTKTDTSRPLGLEGVRDISRISLHPVVSIGGIHSDNSEEVMKAGSNGLAIVSEIMTATNPRKAAAFLKTITSHY